jgi:hypothetical protein
MSEYTELVWHFEMLSLTCRVGGRQPFNYSTLACIHSKTMWDKLSIACTLQYDKYVACFQCFHPYFYCGCHSPKAPDKHLTSLSMTLPWLRHHESQLCYDVLAAAEVLQELSDREYIKWLGLPAPSPPKKDVANAAIVMVELWRRAVSVIPQT